jgi:putative transcriptional regulator
MAMPGMVDGEFAGTVIYLCEHSPKGALGLVINRPTDLSVAGLLEKIDLKLEIALPQNASVYFGGPVHTDRGFVLHSPAGSFSSSIQLGQLALTTSRDVLQAVAEGNGPENAWLTVPASPDVIFATPPEQRYSAALKLLGIDPAMLSGVAGHA